MLEDKDNDEEELPEPNQLLNHIRRRMIEEEEEEEEEVMSEGEEAESEGGNEIEQGWSDLSRFF